MGTEFQDALNEITGGGSAAAPENQREQAKDSPAPAEAGNAFDQGFAAQLQDSTPTDRSHDTPEPGGGIER